MSKLGFDRRLVDNRPHLHDLLFPEFENTFSVNETRFPFTSRPRNFPFGEQSKASRLAT